MVTCLNVHVPAGNRTIAGYILFICDRECKGGDVLIQVKNYFTAFLLNSSFVPNECDYMLWTHVLQGMLTSPLLVSTASQPLQLVIL